MGWGSSIGGAISGAVNNAVDATQSVVSSVTDTVLAPIEKIPVVGGAVSSVSNLSSAIVNKPIDAVQSSGDNLANANAFQRFLVNPFLAPDIIFNKDYAKGLQAAMGGDYKGAQNYLASAGLTADNALATSSPSGGGIEAVDQAFEAILPAGAAEVYRGMSTMQKLAILAVIGVGGFYIWKKFRR